MQKVVLIDVNGQTTLFGQLYARGICRRDYLLTAATGLWAHSAKATVASNNKHNTI